MLKIHEKMGKSTANKIKLIWFNSKIEEYSNKTKEQGVFHCFKSKLSLFYKIFSLFITKPVFK